jgi:hypothetical protein
VRKNMGKQTLNHSFEQGGQNGAEIMPPDFARVTEAGWGRLAMRESLETMFGASIAGAAGAAVASREMQSPVVTAETRPENAGNENMTYVSNLAAAVQADRRPEFVPASPDVQEYAAAQQQSPYAAQPSTPQYSEVQQYTQYAQSMAAPTPGAPQPVQAPASLGGQVSGF